MALAVLGFFVFITKTIPAQEWEESNGWRHPTQATIGTDNPPSQYTGRDAQTIVINAELRPEITGGDLSIEVLKHMADMGCPWPLIRGNGRFMGSYVIESISNKQSNLMYDGKARSISFSMTLKKVADQPFGLRGEALGLAVGMVRALVGV
ncbi:phage tail protein [Neisseria sp. S1]|uniref:phage tail protein n=1 Tax=Neisseria sp. S1 TaxID=3318354 RepID=UPI003A854363